MPNIFKALWKSFLLSNTCKRISSIIKKLMFVIKTLLLYFKNVQNFIYSKGKCYLWKENTCLEWQKATMTINIYRKGRKLQDGRTYQRKSGILHSCGKTRQEVFFTFYVSNNHTTKWNVIKLNKRSIFSN